MEFYIYLDGVGSVLDIRTETVYPMKENGEPDLVYGVELIEISKDWVANLSEADKEQLRKHGIMNRNKN